MVQSIDDTPESGLPSSKPTQSSTKPLAEQGAAVSKSDASNLEALDEDDIELKRKEVAKFLEEDDKKSTTNTKPSNVATSSSVAVDSSKKTSEFFTRLLSQGVSIYFLIKGAWKPVHMVYSPESGSLDGFRDSASATSRIIKQRICSITLRKFSVSTPSLAHQRFSLKTPGNEYNLKPENASDKNLWVDWLHLMEKEQNLLDSQARTVGAVDTASFKNKNPGVDAETFRPSFWVPHEESTTCACCQLPFSLRRWRHTCRTCGFVFCANTKCYLDSKKTCAACLGTSPETISQTTSSDKALTTQTDSKSIQVSPTKKNDANTSSIDTTPKKLPESSAGVSTTSTSSSVQNTPLTSSSTLQAIDMLRAQKNKSKVSQTTSTVSATPLPTPSTTNAKPKPTEKRGTLKAPQEQSSSVKPKVKLDPSENRKVHLEALNNLTSRVDRVMLILVFLGLFAWLSLSVVESLW